jgi:hypothetical protein
VVAMAWKLLPLPASSSLFHREGSGKAKRERQRPKAKRREARKAPEETAPYVRTLKTETTVRSNVAHQSTGGALFPGRMRIPGP